MKASDILESSWRRRESEDLSQAKDLKLWVFSGM